jgi:antitoxin MazE
MATTTVHKWGNGHGILIPRQYFEEMGLKRGDKVELTFTDNRLEVRAVKSYRIEDLLEGYTGPKPGEYDWGEPAGKEMW